MISNLKLLIMENPTVDYILENIDLNDRSRIINWYEKYSSNSNGNLDEIISLLIWCCTEGQYAADTQNPKIFGEIFDLGSKNYKINKKDLESLFFSHHTLFAVMEDFQINDDRPLFIVFEGLDGSGKSTQINMLREKLKLMGRKVSVTAEPTSSATGGLIRDTLSNNYKREASELASLFLTDRISHNVNPVWGIQKFISQGTDVISDRYYYSSFAYQSMGTDMDWIIDMNLNCPQILKPDLCIFLDVDPKRCKNRIDSERAHVEIFENDEDIMIQTRNQFFKVFKKLNDLENIKIVDANRPINVVSDEILKIVLELKKDNL